MNHSKAWSPDAISFDIIADVTSHPVVTVAVTTPIGRLVFMGEPVIAGGRMVVRAVHVQGAAPRSVGWPRLRMIAAAVLEGMGLDELVVEGAVRTTGACPGRRPRPLRFTRRHPAER
jgi:hypothetical protein